MKHRKIALVAALLAGAAGAANALTFDLTYIAGTSAQEQASFAAAAAMWSSIYQDPVTVKLTVGTSALGAGILAQAGSREISYSYNDVRNALGADARSALDATAVANLSPGASVGMLINRTSDNPNGAGSVTPYVDNNGGANNSTISMTAANARALNLGFGIGGVTGACADCDAYIEFSTGFNWDHNRGNGIDANAYDFVGIAAHEIGHALGFISGVDVLDYNSPPNNGPFSADQFTFVSTLDLFRWSDDSTANDVLDWTADNRDKYFSVDRGATKGARFSTGETFGDGRQASHWKDDLGIGIMDPTADVGELLGISASDIAAFDAIGWDLEQQNHDAPEPGSFALAGLSLALVGAVRRRRTAGKR
jgi:hypothetical protein